MDKQELWANTLNFLLDDHGDYKPFNKNPDDEVNAIIYLLYNNDLRDLLEEILRMMFIDLVFDKSKETSVKYRSHGNTAYQAKHYKASIQHYTRAILYAPEGCEELALAYGNRSAALYYCDKFQESIKDIERALRSGYPDVKKHKLFIRLALNELRLKNYSNIINALKEAENNLKDKDNVKKDFEEISNIRTKINGLGLNPTSMPILDTEAEEISKAKLKLVEQKLFEFTGKSVKLIYDEQYGSRAVIANKDILEGEIIFVEKPFASVNILTMDERTAVCFYCFASDIMPISCINCSNSTYCNEVCRESAWTEFHKWECSGCQADLWTNIGIAHLALRVLFAASRNIESSIEIVNNNTSLENIHRIKLDGEGNVVTARTIFDCFNSYLAINKKSEGTNNYPFVFSLMTNLKRMLRDDFLQYAVTAVLMSVYLKKHTDFYASIKSMNARIKMEDKEWEILVASLVFRHLAQLVCNAHSVIAMLPIASATGGFVHKEPCKIASAIYPAISMMNHSCDPNIVTSFYKNIQIVKANTLISKGQEVFNCYGPHFRKMNKKSRQELLAFQYDFVCCCSACRNPIFDYLCESFRGYLCSHCEGPVVVRDASHLAKCLDCQKTQNVTEVLKKAKIADLTFQEAQAQQCTADSLRLMEEALNIRQSCLYRYNTAIADCYEHCAVALSLLGLYVESAEYFSKVIHIFGLHHGSNSLKVGHTYIKLTNTLLAHIKKLEGENDNKQILCELCVKTKGALDQSIRILLLHYGPWTDVVRQTMKNIKFINVMIKKDCKT